MNNPVFANEKAKFLRFAEVLRRSESAEHLRDLLYADIEAPYHTFDLVWLTCIPETIGDGLADLLSKTVDDEEILNEC